MDARTALFLADEAVHEAADLVEPAAAVRSVPVVEGATVLRGVVRLARHPVGEVQLRKDEENPM